MASLDFPQRPYSQMAWPGCNFYHPLQRACNHHYNKEAIHPISNGESSHSAVTLSSHRYAWVERLITSCRGRTTSLLQFIFVPAYPCSSANCVVWHFWGWHKQMPIHPRWSTDNKPKKPFYTSCLVERWACWRCVHKDGREMTYKSTSDSKASI